MEAGIMLRLRARRDKLLSVIEEAQKVIADGVPVDRNDIVRIKLSLRNTISTLDKEVNVFLEKCGSHPDIEMGTLTAIQLQAEDLVINFETAQDTSDYNTKSYDKNEQSVSKLPKLEMSKYNGDVLLWSEFYDRFEATVGCKPLKDVDKLSYLVESLGGEALEAISGLNITNANYAIAMELLINRYGKKERVIDAHYDALNKLAKASNIPVECRRTINQFEKHLRILESLGEDINSKHLRVLLLQKFPEEILYQVHMLTVGNDTVGNIRKILDNVITASEKAIQPSTSVPSQKCTTEALHLRNYSVMNKKRKAQYVLQTTDMNKRRRIECTFCKGAHFSDMCDKVVLLQERRKKLSGKCFLCFKPGHTFAQCRVKIPCAHCKARHNRALCPKKCKAQMNKRSTNEGKTLYIYNDDDEICHSNNTTTSKCSLQTAVVEIKNKNKSCKGRLLLDSGSQRSYITDRLVKKLGISSEKEDLLLIFTFGSESPIEKISPSVKVTIKTKRGKEKELVANVVPHITEKISISPKHLYKSVDIRADDDSQGETIDILVGNDYYFSFIRDERIEIEDDLYLINTDFGWILSGHATDATTDNENVLTIITYCQCHGSDCPYFTEPDLPLRNIDMKGLWTLEGIGITDSPKASREEEAVKFFNDTVKYTEGRYQVKWPWVQSPPDLPTNFSLSFGRLRSLLRRLDENDVKEYNKILEEQLKAGVIEIVNTECVPFIQQEPPIHYLPHHIVHQAGKRGRIVYDASAKVKDRKSLNECLYRGPSMLEDLTALLLKFRCGEIGIIADVEKAFLQIGLQDADKDVTRFLWLKDVTKDVTEDNLLHYRFCRVPFGIISSPFLLTATIRYHLSNKNAGLLKEIADKCYVDNLVTCSDNLPEALTIFEESRQAFDELGMNIREWMSNSETFMKTIPEKIQAKKDKRVKVLGLVWNVQEDTLHLKLHEDIFLEKERATKKDVLRTLARVYDPCGFVSPLILPAKMLFQELCTATVKWDSKLPENLMEKWSRIVRKLKLAQDVQVPRYVNEGLPDKDVTYELHTFADASKNAFSAVTYLRTIGKKNIKTTFLMSKSRITPISDKEDLKIPRLELLAFVIGIRLLKYINTNLELPIKKQYLWSDSLIVLSWIKSDKLLPPFVARRVDEIKKSNDVEFRYVNTRENPADVATRPDLWEEGKELWFSGPNYLSQDEALWPCQSFNEKESIFVSSERTLDSKNCSETERTELETIVSDEYIDLPIDNSTNTEREVESMVCDSVDDESGDHNKQSLNEIKRLQAEFYPVEITGKESHLSKNLGLYLDVDGILRSRGRLANTNWPYDMKHPILLPKNCRLTDEIVKSIHEKNYHVGIPHTLSLVRQKYWIPQGRSQVQKIIKKCPQCIKHGGGPYKLPATPALPTERVSYSAPFKYTGMDYFGPVFVNSESGSQKRWVCLFTCLAVRAIHMEVVKNLTAEECLLAIRRFVATRGLPSKIVSDNAQQFKLTSEILMKPFCEENNISWKFIPQLAPWHGGFYERLVALVKHCMKRTLEKHLLNDNQLLTIIKEIEAVLNTRPLTYVGADQDLVLRPADFLTLGNCITPIPTETSILGKSTQIKTDLFKSWRKGQNIIEDFRKMFTFQYLPSLRERYNHSTKQPRVKSSKSPEIGDIVQIKDDSQKRINWKVGKIVHLVEGQDGLFRVAKVRVGDVDYTRSIGHLYPLEADTNLEEDYVESFSPTLESRDSVPGPSTSKCDDLIIRQMVRDHQTHPTADMKEKIDIADNVQTEDTLIPASPSVDVEVGEDIPLSDTVAEINNDDLVDQSVVDVAERPVRAAAQRAREKMAEWTRYLVAILQ